MSTPPPPHWPLPPHQPQAPGQAQAPLNGFALASLLVGLLCLPPLGAVFGVVALVQIARKRERGKALAIVGLAVSLVMSAGLVFATDRLADSFFDRVSALERFEDVEGELADIEELHAGECFNVPGGDLLDEDPFVYRIACTEVHHAEVTSLTRLSQTGYPGPDRLRKSAADECWKAQDAYAMDSWALPEYAEMFYFSPSRESWDEGDRTLLCVIGTTGEEHRGSLRKDAGMLKPEQVVYLRAANEVELAMGRMPEADVEDELAAYRAWAREVDQALANEARMLEEAARRPEVGVQAAARLKEVEAARGEWQQAGREATAAGFDRSWGRALAALTVETEKALRGAYGLSTTVPGWMEEAPAGPDGSEEGGTGGSGGSGGGSGGGPGKGPATGAA
ncbi:septum formation family protein [Streptomyces sp. NPDC091268]|uniref:DUF4190 domain-containing protein n=1 Tax=Streptomyces sp. NPDC091268 TaxID=3365979 RepID=UPI0037F3B331